MENTFIQNNTVKKVLIAIIFILLFNFIVPCYNNVSFSENTYEADLKENKKSIGGKLLAPIKSLLLFLGDSVLQILQNSFVSQSPVVISVQSKDYGELNGWVTAGIIAGSVLILGAFCIAGIGAITAAVAIKGAVTAASGVIGTIAAVGGTIGTGAGAAGMAMLGGGLATGIGGSVLFHKIERDNYANWKGVFELPYIMYSPGRIFSNSIPLFDINFINPQVSKHEYKYGLKVTGITTASMTKYSSDKDPIEKIPQDADLYDSYINIQQQVSEISREIEQWASEFEDIFGDGELQGIYDMVSSTCSTLSTNLLAYQTAGMIDGMNEEIEVFNTSFKARMKDIEKYLHSLKITEAQAKKIENLDGIGINTSKLDEPTDVIEYKSSAQVLQKTVASWYKTLRTLAIVALLTILVYVGIRMVLSSTGKDKAKYKQMIMDWLIAVCLLFVMHYMMAFILYVSEQLTELCKESDIENVAIEVPANLEYADKDGKLQPLFEENISSSPDSGNQYSATATSENTIWWGSNFIGLIRLEAGLPMASIAYKSFGYTVIYLVLVIYTCVFTFMYLKRVLWMAFLTMIAPLVAITYPIDKINDGKAQAFSLWLKEYIFNALMQPIHYLIYTIIMGSAMVLIVDHPVYALVALGFMMPAEKFIRKMFGFEKASTPAALGGAAAAGMMMNTIQRLTGKPPHGDKEDEAEDAKPKSTKTKTVNNTNPFGYVTGSGTPTPSSKGASEGSQNAIGENGTIPIKLGTSTNGKDKNKTTIGAGTNIGTRSFIKDPYAGIRSVAGALGQSSNTTTTPTSRETKKPVNKNGDSYTFTQNGGTKNGNGDSTINNIIAANERAKNVGKNSGKTISGAQTLGTSKNNINKSSDNKTNVKEVTGENKKRNIKSKINSGLLVAGSYYRDKAVKRGKKFRPIRAMRRALAFGAGALTGGAIAAAATIVDPAKAEQYLMAGIYGGGKFAQGLSDKAASVVNLKGGTNAFVRGYLGKEYENIDDKIYKMNYGLDYNNMSKAVQKLGADGAKDLFKDGGVAHQCIDQGIYDISDIIQVYKGKNAILDHGLLNGREPYKVDNNKNKMPMTQEEAATTGSIQAFKDMTRFGDVLNDNKKMKNAREHLRDDISTYYKNEHMEISDADLEKEVDRRIDAIRLVSGENSTKYQYGPNGELLEREPSDNNRETLYDPTEFLRQKELPEELINANKASMEEKEEAGKPKAAELKEINEQNDKQRDKLKEEYNGKELDDDTVKIYQKNGIYKLEEMYKIDSAKDEFLKHISNNGATTEESEKKARDMSIAAYNLSNKFGDLTNENEYKKFKEFTKKQGYTPEQEENLTKALTYYDGYTGKNIEHLDEKIEEQGTELNNKVGVMESASAAKAQSDAELERLRQSRYSADDDEKQATISIEEVESRMKAGEINKVQADKEKAVYEEQKREAERQKEKIEEQRKAANKEAAQKAVAEKKAKEDAEEKARRYELLEIKKKAAETRKAKYEETRKKQQEMKNRNGMGGENDSEKQGDDKSKRKGGRKDTKSKETEKDNTVKWRSK